MPDLNIEELAQLPEVREILNMLLLLCIKDEALELHIEPLEEKITMISRGSRTEFVSPSQRVFWGIIGRLRIMAGLPTDIGRPQSGTFKLSIGEEGSHQFSVRTVPVLGGEDILVSIYKK